MRTLYIVFGVVACFAACAHGHGSLVIPPPRQAIDRFAAPWKGGYSQHCKNGSLACKIPNTQDDCEFDL
jgi:hypothetical protein